MKTSLRPGEIDLELIPVSWPLTPLDGHKAAYITGWQQKPFSVDEIKREIESGRCEAVGLIAGPVSNEPFGFVWVDVDGPTVYETIQEESQLSIEEALPATLSIRSGRDGRERKLYRLDKKNWKHFPRTKYAWHAEGNGEKLEILWKKRQGVLMGAHPDTAGFFTPDGQGFEWSKKIPELPVWILEGIKEKNKKNGRPLQQTNRLVGQDFAINATFLHEREMTEAVDALWNLPAETADDHDAWIMFGQVLHSVDESLLPEWERWSQQSHKYKEGECQKRWRSFNSEGGLTIRTLEKAARENGWPGPSRDFSTLPVGDRTLDMQEQILKEMEEQLEMPVMAPQRSLATEWAPPPPSGPVSEKKGKNAPANEIVNLLHYQFNTKLKFSNPHKKFFKYGHLSPGLWSPLSENEILKIIRDSLEEFKTQFLPQGYSNNLIKDIYAQLQSLLNFDNWYDGREYLLFTNGILNIETMELLDFDPSLFIINQLPYHYNPDAKCKKIIQWLSFTQRGSKKRVELLRAWLRSILLGRSEIQKFVEILGPGKSGKSTFANLAHSLVGSANVISTNLRYLEESRFETAKLMNKKLVLINDSERYGGNVVVLKNITGGDLIRIEHKFENESSPGFKFEGMVMLTANEAIQSTDASTGLVRRRLTIPFDRPFTGSAEEQKILIEIDKRGNPNGEFAVELAGLVNWLLAMTEDEMRSYLINTEKKVPFIRKYNLEIQKEVSPLMSWLDECVVFDPSTTVSIGKASRLQVACQHLDVEHSPKLYKNSDDRLYPSYVEYCVLSNSSPVKASRFYSLLLQTLHHDLKLQIQPALMKKCKALSGLDLRLRSDTMSKHKEYPSIVEVGHDQDTYREFYQKKHGSNVQLQFIHPDSDVC